MGTRTSILVEGKIAAFALFKGLRAYPDVEAVFVARERPEPNQGAALGNHTADGSEILFRTEIEFFRFSQRQQTLVYRDFRSLLDWFRPSVVHFHHYVHLGLELLREVHNHAPSVPIVLTLHEFLAICHNNGQMVKVKDGDLCYEASPAACSRCFPDISPQDFFLRKAYIKSFLELADAFVSPSDFLIQRYVQWGLPTEKFVKIENGLRTAGDGSAPRRPAGSGLRFGFFGQIHPFKGLHVLLEALALLPKDLREGPNRISLDVHGTRLSEQSDSYQLLIRDRLKKVKDLVTMHGPYAQSDIPGLMRNVDWVVMPSVWWENSPLVIQEAFANGAPVICSAIGGMAEKVQDGVSGLQFRVRDARHLADRMAEAATTPGLLEKLRGGIPPVTSASTMAEQHLDLYGRLVSARSKQRMPVESDEAPRHGERLVGEATGSSTMPERP